MTKDQRIRLMISILLVCLAYPLSCLTGRWAMDWSVLVFPSPGEYYLSRQWIQLPDPPANIMRFIAVDEGVLYAEAENGALYSCVFPSDLDPACWLRVAAPPNDRTKGCPPEEQWFWSGFPDLPDGLEAIESIEIIYCGSRLREPAISAFRYVRTTDGQFWQWGVDELDYVTSPNYDGRSWSTLGKQLYFTLFFCWAVFPLTALVILAVWMARPRRKE